MNNIQTKEFVTNYPPSPEEIRSVPSSVSAYGRTLSPQSTNHHLPPEGEGKSCTTAENSHNRLASMHISTYMSDHEESSKESKEVEGQQAIEQATKPLDKSTKANTQCSDHVADNGVDNGVDNGADHADSLSKLISLLKDLKLPEKCQGEPLKHVFSPNLEERHWHTQLEVLKECNAKICGIEMSQFTSVDVIDLSQIKARELNRLSVRKQDELIVVYGECIQNGVSLFIANTTVIGSGAEIWIGEDRFNLAVEEAVIRANEQSDWICGDNWELPKYLGEGDITQLLNTVYTCASLLDAGHYPLVYLYQASLMGVTLNCGNVSQAIVGSKGKINVINNIIKNSLPHCIFIHDSNSTLSNNEIDGDNQTTFSLDKTATLERIIEKLRRNGLSRNENCEFSTISDETISVTPESET